MVQYNFPPAYFICTVLFIFLYYLYLTNIISLKINQVSINETYSIKETYI